MRKGRLFICSIFVLICIAESSPAALTIAHKGTPNATLLYNGKPMLKVGPLPEVAVFAVGLGSKSFDVEQWLDWMARYEMGYGRVYPESSYDLWQALDSDKRLFPFDVVQWKKGHPVVDLTRFNRRYPRVKWQLAHCARCFIPSFLEESIDQLTELENMWFDTSAVCESDVFDVLFSRGPRERILFGTDNLPAGVDRGKYVAFGYAWQVLREDNQTFDLSHCNPNPTWVAYEELRALRRIAQRFGFTQGEIEDLFYNNASRLLASIGA